MHNLNISIYYFIIKKFTVNLFQINKYHAILKQSILNCIFIHQKKFYYIYPFFIAAAVAGFICFSNVIILSRL